MPSRHEEAVRTPRFPHNCVAREALASGTVLAKSKKEAKAEVEKAFKEAKEQQGDDEVHGHITHGTK